MIKVKEHTDTSTQFLIENVLKNYSDEYAPEVKNKIDLLLRRRLSKPVIYIGAGTCGIAAGADKT